MSQENVEVFREAIKAYNRRDIDAFLDAFDPMVETHPLTLAMFGQETTVYRGHEGLRQLIRDVDEVLSQLQARVLEVRDLGERLVASGRLRGRGKASGADIESPIGWLVEFKNGRVIRMTDFLDPQEALEAAGLSE
jgi:ketosteroid isomerase-like protein